MGKIFFVLFLLLLLFPIKASPEISDAEAERRIQASIQNYSGNCPCPYSRDRRGHRCGKRSAYSRPGGYEPICYKSDIKE
ncbi:MAG: hypothetical protein PHI50_04140 [Alphaproteobacteria bacterium]|nr:hypothetical protein [Alphaproteobacteria bacterium]